MSAFTPGPWQAEKHGLITAEVNGVRRQVASAQGDAVMHGDPSIDVVTLQQSNARLIAAAPDLLEALEGLRLDDWMTYEGNLEASGYASVDALKFARAAIRKAKGEL
jgi:hypothetical protein